MLVEKKRYRRTYASDLNQTRLGLICNNSTGSIGLIFFHTDLANQTILGSDLIRPQPKKSYQVGSDLADSHCYQYMFSCTEQIRIFLGPIRRFLICFSDQIKRQFWFDLASFLFFVRTNQTILV